MQQQQCLHTARDENRNSGANYMDLFGYDSTKTGSRTRRRQRAGASREEWGEDTERLWSEMCEAAKGMSESADLWGWSAMS
eukprot:COSAG06_NODE_23001_length_705_cov_13.384488_2_plen_80_part_01